MRTAVPQTRAEAFALSRAVTLIARAVAEVAAGLAVKWEDADYIVPPSLIDEGLAKLAVPGGTAPNLWARLLVHPGPANPDGRATLVAGTVGMHAFGLRDIEYAPSPWPIQELLGHASAVADYLMQPGVVLRDGQTLGTPGQGGFHVRARPRGLFLSSPIFLLEPAL